MRLTRETKRRIRPDSEVFISAVSVERLPTGDEIVGAVAV
jgi:hypothetical protein